MKTFMRRFIVLAVAMLALAPGYFAQSPTPADAAARIYVDDAQFNNLSVSCPATPYTTVQQGVDAAPDGATITVCEGVYYDSVRIIGRDNLKLIAQGTVQLAPPLNFTGVFADAFRAKNLTIQGFIFNGNNILGTSQYGTGSVALSFSATSGKIVKNHFINWGQSNPATATTDHTAIYVHNAIGAGDVTIDHNTFNGFQEYGIWMEFTTKAKITRNQFIVTSAGAFAPTAIYVHDSVGVTVSGNTIRSNWGLYNANASSTGIYIRDSTANKVTGNTVTGVAFGIKLGCLAQSTKNTISKNTINESLVGITIQSEPSLNCPDGFTGNTISGNKVYQTTLSAGYGIRLDIATTVDLTRTTVKGNTIAGYLNGIPILPGLTPGVVGVNKVMDTPPPGL